ncbi:MAG: class F sortase, partial [Candidatus Promineifilaceae bacterium]|nr:class F sortase [Candidatus Promineifilaceae bacterium]
IPVLLLVTAASFLGTAYLAGVRPPAMLRPTPRLTTPLTSGASATDRPARRVPASPTTSNEAATSRPPAPTRPAWAAEPAVVAEAPGDEAPPAAAATVPPVRRSSGRPFWLTIPAAELSTAVEGVGLTAEQAMATPADWDNVGWFELGYAPGQPGTAVIGGHLDAPGGRDAAFTQLGRLQPGDLVRVEMSTGLTHLYRVAQRLRYPYDDAPLAQIFAWSPEPRLALITCAGDWNRAARSYEERLVVYADYVGQTTTPTDGGAAGLGSVAGDEDDPFSPAR